MTRFCVVYSLEFGVVSLCIISILVSGGLICNHQLKFPGQIRDWRNASIYYDDQLDMLDLNVKIATWVLVGDIMCTLLMVLPVAMTDIETPWKERNCRRKLLIPCIIGKILCNFHGIAAFVWITLKFNYNCPEIMGILIALALYVFLGWYLIVVVGSYFLQLGMRMTFHKLRHSTSGSTRQSQDSRLQYQKAEMGESGEIPSPKAERNGNQRREKVVEQGLKGADDNAGRKIEYQGHETHRGSQRKLYEHDDPDERKPLKNADKRSRSSQEALDDKRYESKEKLKSNEADAREEQYRKLLKKSRGSLDHIDNNDDDDEDERYRSNERIGKGIQRSRDNIRQIGPDQREYRVSEREETDGGGKRRYYYKRDKRDPYERPTEDETDTVEGPRRTKPDPRRARRESDDSLGSMGRIRSPPKYAPPRSQSDGSHDSHEGIRNDPYRQKEPQNYGQYGRPPPRSKQAAPQSQPYHRDSDDSLGRERVPPRYRPPPRRSDSSYDDRGRPERPQRDERSYYDPPRRYYDEEPPRHDDYDDYDYQQGRSSNARPSANYRDNENGDYGYNDDEYDQAPPYEDRRQDQDGYISSEV